VEDTTAVHDETLAEPAPAGEPPRSEASRLPATAWPPWTAPAALVGGIVLAAVAGLLVDIPALAFGVNISGSHLPGGLVIANTAVQDGAFVFAAVFFAQLGGRAISAAQFGLRPTRNWQLARTLASPLKRLRRRARDAGLLALILLSFLLLSGIWVAIFHPEKEKLLEQLGAGESTSLLLASAALTCVVAPVCEEFLFRGFIFGALRNWRGVAPAAVITGLLFGGVHVGSAPVIDLVPLAILGVLLCLLYQHTGSLYPCFALHAINNSLAFGSLEDWGWQIPLLMLASLGLIGLLVATLTRAGVIAAETPTSGANALAQPPWPSL
jgi:uncharacterized protein